MKLKIGFTGDIAFSEYTKNIRNDNKAIDKKIYETLNENDYNVLNFESPITESNITKKNALAHKSEKENLTYIKEKFKNPILSIANNHMMDFGIKGLLDTINNIKNVELPFIGAGLNQQEATDYIIIGEEIKVGILAFQYKNYNIATKTTPGTAQDKHIKIIKRKIKELKQKVDWVVLIYHGGEEFLNFPMPYTRNKLIDLLSYGVDIIVAHHPHTVQGYEKIGKKTIFYSLGNFIFDTDFQRAQENTDEGLLLNITFSKNNYTYKVTPLKKDREKNTLRVENKNPHFIDVSKNYDELWKKEALKIREIKRKKRNLKRYRDNYSINNLHMVKIEELELMPFSELVEKNYIEELNKMPKFKDKNILVRKIRSKTKKLRKLKKATKEDFIKRIYINSAKRYNAKQKGND